MRKLLFAKLITLSIVRQMTKDLVYTMCVHVTKEKHNVCPPKLNSENGL